MLEFQFRKVGNTDWYTLTFYDRQMSLQIKISSKVFETGKCTSHEFPFNVVISPIALFYHSDMTKHEIAPPTAAQLKPL